MSMYAVSQTQLHWPTAESTTAPPHELCIYVSWSECCARPAVHYCVCLFWVSEPTPLLSLDAIPGSLTLCNESCAGMQYQWLTSGIQLVFQTNI